MTRDEARRYDWMEFYDDAYDENIRQCEKRGWQRENSNFEWMAILVEEIGEAAKEVLEGNLKGNLYVELTQIAAVAAAFATYVRKHQ